MSDNAEVVKIRETISQIKQDASEWLTNFYFSDEELAKNIVAKKLSWRSFNNTFVAVHKRKNLNTILFFASDLDNLTDALRQVSANIEVPMTINFGVNVRDEAILKNLGDRLSDVGFTHYATHIRMTKINPKTKGDNPVDIDPKWYADYADVEVIAYGADEDCDEVEQILYEGLDYRCDIFPDSDELHEMVKNREILIAEDITSHEIAAIHLCKWHSNVIVEGTAWVTREKYRQYFYGLPLRDVYLHLTADVRRQILYIREPKMQKFHEHFGFRADGFQNHVFLKESPTMYSQNTPIISSEQIPDAFSAMNNVDEVSRLKSIVADHAGGGCDLITNFYVGNRETASWIRRKQLFGYGDTDGYLLLRTRRGFCNAYFGTNNLQSFPKLLTLLTRQIQIPISVDLINTSTETAECFLQSKFVRHVSLMRMSKVNNNVNAVHSENDWFAESRDVNTIEETLYENMNPLCEQIPDTEDLASAVDNRQILVARHISNNEAAAFIFFERKGVTVTLRFWAGRKKYHGLGYGKEVYQKYLMANADARRFLLWVRDDNHKVRQIYQRYGMNYENMHDDVYLWRRNFNE